MEYARTRAGRLRRSGIAAAWRAAGCGTRRGRSPGRVQGDGAEPPGRVHHPRPAQAAVAGHSRLGWRGHDRRRGRGSSRPRGGRRGGAVPDRLLRPVSGVPGGPGRALPEDGHPRRAHRRHVSGVAGGAGVDLPSATEPPGLGRDRGAAAGVADRLAAAVYPRRVEVW